MAVYHIKIKKGETWDRQFQWLDENEAPMFDLSTGWTAAMIVGTKNFTTTYFTAVSTGGTPEITMNSSAQIFVVLPPSLTNLLVSEIVGEYRLKLTRTSDGFVAYPLNGDVEVNI
jgi:hypothetical protein